MIIDRDIENLQSVKVAESEGIAEVSQIRTGGASEPDNCLGHVPLCSLWPSICRFRSRLVVIGNGAVWPDRLNLGAFSGLPFVQLPFSAECLQLGRLTDAFIQSGIRVEELQVIKAVSGG